MILWQRLATIGLAAVANFLTRVLPFGCSNGPAAKRPGLFRASGIFCPGRLWQCW